MSERKIINCEKHIAVDAIDGKCALCEIARLREVLKDMINTHGMHGPCKNHSCSSCDRAYKNAKQALKRGE